MTKGHKKENYIDEVLNSINEMYSTGLPFTQLITYKRLKKLYALNPDAVEKNSRAMVNLANCYYKKKHYDQAFALYKIAALSDCAIGLRKLANCFMFGKGTEKNYTKAFELYQNAVNAGDSLAEIYLGMCYDYGMGTEQNYKLAYNLYKKSSEEGYLWAKRRLADYYFEGLASDVDYEKAAELYKVVAHACDSYAMEKLSKCYGQGKGIKKSKIKMIWYFLSSCTQSDITIHSKEERAQR